MSDEVAGTVCGFIGLAAIFFGAVGLRRSVGLDKPSLDLRAKIASLQEENARLREEVRRLRGEQADDSAGNPSTQS